MYRYVNYDDDDSDEYCRHLLSHSQLQGKNNIQIIYSEIYT